MHLQKTGEETATFDMYFGPLDLVEAANPLFKNVNLSNFFLLRETTNFCLFEIHHP